MARRARAMKGCQTLTEHLGPLIGEAPGFDPGEHEHPRLAVASGRIDHAEDLRDCRRARGPADPAQARGLSRVATWCRLAGGLDKDDAVVGKARGVRVIEITAGDSAKISDSAPQHGRRQRPNGRSVVHSSVRPWISTSSPRQAASTMSSTRSKPSGAAVVGIGNFEVARLNRRAVKLAQQSDLSAPFWILAGEPQQVPLVLGIGSKDEIEAVEILASHLPRDAVQIDPPAPSGRPGARVGGVSHVPGANAGTVHLHLRRRAPRPRARSASSPRPLESGKCSPCKQTATASD